MINQGVTFVQEFLGLLEECSSQHHDSGGPVSNLIILTLGELNEESGNWVLDLHFLHDGGSVVSDGDLLIGGDKQLVSPDQ